MANELGAGAGSGYPATIDLDAIPETTITTVRADVPNDLANAIIKVETELGINPAGTQTDVVTYLQNGHETDGSHKYIFKAWEPPYNCPVDGTSDCKTAIQAAIDAAEAVGGTVVLPHVDMVLESGLTITDSIRLIGMGAYGSVLKPDDNFTCITVEPTSDDTVNGGLELKGFGIDYGANGGLISYGVFFASVAAARRARAYEISNMRILGHYIGVYDGKSTGGGVIRNMYFKTTIASSTCVNISGISADNQSVALENIYFGGSGANGNALGIGNTQSVTASNLTITGYNHAIQATNAFATFNGVYITGCTCDVNGLIYLTSSNGNYVFNGLKTQGNTIGANAGLIHTQTGVHAVFNSPRIGGDAECNDTTTGSTAYLFEIESGTKEVIVNGWGSNTILDGGNSIFASDTGGKLTINVGAQDQIIAKSANYTINAWIDKHIQASGASTTITLPDATQNKGRIYTIERDDATNVITVDTTAGNIGDQATVTMNGDGDTMTVRSDGTDWQFVSYIGLIF